MMNFSTLAVRCARATPSKMHIALPLLLMAGLYWLSSIPGTPSSEDPASYDVIRWVAPSVQNVLHVPAYAVLAWAWRWALGAWLRGPTALAISAGAIALSYGVLDEWHQAMVPGRYATLTDIALNAAGCALGIWVFHWALLRARNAAAT